MTEESDDNDTVEIPNLRKQVLQEEQMTSGDEEQLHDGVNRIGARRNAWLEWFSLLSEQDKKIVELCTEKGVSVTAANFDRLKEIVIRHYAEDGDMNDES